MDALAAPLLFFWMNLFKPEQPKMTHAHHAMINMLKAFVPEKSDGLSVAILKQDWEMQELVEAVMDVAPGGFLIVPGDYGLLTRYFALHHWDLMPFMYDQSLIFRKQV